MVRPILSHLDWSLDNKKKWLKLLQPLSEINNSNCTPRSKRNDIIKKELQINNITDTRMLWDQKRNFRLNKHSRLQE
jgi:hypothetical protein